MDEQKSIPKVRAALHTNGGEQHKNGSGEHILQRKTESSYSESESLGSQSENTMSMEAWHRQHRWKVQRFGVIVALVFVIVTMMSVLLSEYISVLRHSYLSRSEILQAESENIHILKKQKEIEKRLSLLELQQQEILSAFHAVRDSVDSVHFLIGEFTQESATRQKLSDFISPEKRESENE